MTESKTPTSVPREAGASSTTQSYSIHTPQNDSLLRRALVTVFDGLLATACPAALWDSMERQLAGLGTTCRLSAALTMGEAGSDRSFVPFYVRAPTEVVPQIPRLLKYRSKDGRPGLAEVVAQGFQVRCLIRATDVDTIPHLPISGAQLADVARKLERYECCYYFTRRGFRVIQVLSRWLTPTEYEITTARWLKELQTFLSPAWNVDTSCRDWTRHFRLPAHGPVTFQQVSPIDPGDCRPPPKPWKPAPTALLPLENHGGNTRYGQIVLDSSLDAIRTAPDGDRHKRIYRASARVANYVAGGELSDTIDALLAVCPDDHERACRDGYQRGLQTPKTAPTRNPFDLAALRAQARAELQERIAQHTDDDGNVSF